MKASSDRFIHVLPVNEVKSESLFETNKPNFSLSLVPSKDAQDEMSFLLQVSHITKDINNTPSSKSRNTAPRFDFAVLGKKRESRKKVFLNPRGHYPCRQTWEMIPG